MRHPVLALVALALALGFPPPETGASPAVAASPFLRGMVVSCPRWGPVWGSPAMAEALSELSRLGVSWAAIHPYAWIKRDGEVRYRPAAELDFLSEAARLADAAGIELFWKPHLGYWGSFSWRGAIDFGDDEAAWRRFFDGYRGFIVDQARLAARLSVPLFAVGVEIERTTRFEAEWRRILSEVRAVYPGRITYAANWDSLDAVPFWDAVDVIGVHGYFPLAEGDADVATLTAGWEEPLGELRELARTHGKRVLFAEIGYNRNRVAASAPWEHRIEDAPATRELRARLIEVAIERLEAEPFVEGMFWWKWIPGDNRHDRDFSMKDPEARAALARQWAPAAAATR